MWSGKEDGDYYSPDRVTNRVSQFMHEANPTITLKIYALAMSTDDDAAAALWSQVTRNIVARTRKQTPQQKAGPVLVTSCDIKKPKLA